MIKWVNYRCIKCNKIISIECNHPFGIPNQNLIKIIDYESGIRHGCNLEKGELPIIIAMSCSDEPLKEAVDIRYLSTSGNYNDLSNKPSIKNFIN